MASRTQKSIRNATVGLGVQICTLLLEFGVRTALVYGLGRYYLGLNSVMTGLLAMYSLAELGMGNALVYSMYEPLARGDRSKTEAYLALFKKVYRVIGVTIVGIAVLATPLIPRIVNTDMTTEVYAIYALFTANTAISYLAFAYRGSLMQADQNRYLVSLSDLVFAIVSSTGQIVCFAVFNNYIAGLCFLVIGQLLKNLFVFCLSKTKYRHISFSSKEKLAPAETTQLKKNIFAMAIGRFSDTANNSFLNVVISAFVGLVESGLFSNYQMVSNAIVRLSTQLFGAVTPSVGNLHVEAPVERQKEVFLEITYLSAWVYITIVTMVWAAIDPFIQLWTDSSDYILPKACTLGVAVNLLTIGLLRATVVFKDGCGIFYQGRYRPVASCILTVVFAVALSQPFGIAGAIWASPLSRVLTALWYDPYLVYKHVFGERPWEYYLLTAKFILATAASLSICTFACKLIASNTIGTFLIAVACAAVVSQGVFLVLFGKNPHFMGAVSLVHKKRQAEQPSSGQYNS